MIMASQEQVAYVGDAFIIIHNYYTNKKKYKKKRWRVRQLLQLRKTYSGKRFIFDLHANGLIILQECQEPVLNI